MSTLGERLMPGTTEEARYDTPPETPPSRSPGPGGTRRKIGIVIIAAVVVTAATYFARSGHKERDPRSVKSGAAEQAAATNVLRLKGTTEAIHSRAIVAPVLSGQQVGILTVTKLLAAGTRVKQGDLLVEFDRQAQMRDFLDKQAEYNRLVGQVADQTAKESAARAKDETEVHQADSDLKNAELEMKRVELLSQIDAEKARLTLEQAKATLSQLKETFDLKRAAAHAAIRILEIQRGRTQRIMQNAQANAERMQIHSPLDGVVVLNTIWKQGRIAEPQEGDQIRPGVSFMQVVDPSAMQVQVPVNQEDVLALEPGQSAEVRVDAYPDLVLTGKLEQIAPVGRGGTFSGKVRIFSAIFSIQGRDARLMPDLSAAVDIRARHRDPATRAQR